MSSTQLEFPFIKKDVLTDRGFLDGPAIRMTAIVAAEMDYSALLAAAADTEAEITYFELHPQECPVPATLKRVRELIDCEMEERIVAGSCFVSSRTENND